MKLTRVLFSIFIFCFGALASTTPPAQARLLFIGQGKGSGLGWEVGLLKALEQKVPAFDRGQIIFAADSGPSVLGAFFACKGFSASSLAEAETLLKRFDPKLVNDNPAAKLITAFKKIGLAHLFGRTLSWAELETSLVTLGPESMNDVLDWITENGTCVPRLPLLIATANQDILDNRNQKIDVDEKQLDYDNDSVYDADEKYLGKACTYFATPDVMEALARVPWQERLCDLRPIRNAQDLRLAVLASVSEPTYLPRVAEPHPELIVSDGIHPVTSRWYNGGFVIPGAVQDLRRLFPSLPTIGSGRPEYSSMEKAVVRGLYAVHLEPALQHAKWWLDVIIQPSPDEWTWIARPHKDYPASVERLVDDGEKAAEACLEVQSCVPAPSTVQVSKLDYAIGGSPDQPVKTGRGRAIWSELTK